MPAAVPSSDSDPTLPRHRHGQARTIALGFVCLWFLVGGVAHFVATDLEMRIVPPYIPWPRAAVWVSGGFELLGAAGLLWRPLRAWAGGGLFVLTLAVTPAHIYMLQQPGLFDIPYWALLLRLPLQAALLALIAWSTWPARQPDDLAQVNAADRRDGPVTDGGRR